MGNVREPRFLAWVDGDGRHVVTRHDCNGATLTAMLPWPNWHAINGSPHGTVTPSVHCLACGAHELVHLSSAPADWPDPPFPAIDVDDPAAV